ncbi:hypothetical protein [Haloarchaeobius sp. HRN-SO-5]|uniref:hypothetical protein n=1 Tax=Haloarchaeobius sp. HRN-SO-5 TaxID=3446118 RepID=UPI003EBED44D
MRRRQLLAALPTTALAGCLSGLGELDDRLSHDGRTPPDGVEFVEFTHPDSVRATRETRLGGVVRNTADTTQAGTVSLELSPDGEQWRRLLERSYELAPGEQQIVETPTTTHFLGPLHLRLVPFDRRTRVESTDPTLPYGDAYVLPNGIHLTVADPTSIDSYEYEADGQRQTATQREDWNWYLATVTARNEGDETATAPYRTAFGTMGYDWNEAIVYRAEDAYEGGELQPGASRSGAVLFESRYNSSTQPIRIRHPYQNGTVGATWTPP